MTTTAALNFYITCLVESTY